MKLFLLTSLTMIAFAANSVFARLALGDGSIDATTFSLVRLGAGALTLVVLASNFSQGVTTGTETSNKVRNVLKRGGSWASATALLVYIVGFSFAYLALDTGTGALILFTCVQATMIGWGMVKGIQPSALEWLGLGIAFAAFAYLVSPGLTAPSPLGALLMALAGIGWGAYSLRGRSAIDPLMDTAGNFVRASQMMIAVCIVFAFVLGPASFKIDGYGFALALASGAITSGLGYALWYTCLPKLTSTRAAIVQLSVPAIAALGGAVFAGESLTVRLILCSVLILGGVAIAILGRARSV